MDDDSAMSRNIVVSGLPANVTADKRTRFLQHMTNKVTQVLGHDKFSIHFVLDEDDGRVIGAFLTFATVHSAEDALARLNLFPFTKTDILTTYRWSALKSAGAPPEEYKPPEVEEGAETDLTHTMAEDPMARPQFFIKQGESYDVEWYWFNYTASKAELYRKPRADKTDSIGRWAEMDRRQKNLGDGLVYGALTTARPMPAWSTFGRIVISQHVEGLKLWGGRQMHMLFEVPELDIKAFFVSPQEKYLVVKTMNGVSVWDIKLAKKIRSLGCLDLTDTDKWPITRYNASDEFVAIAHASPDPAQAGKLNIYRAETMRVLPSASASAVSHTFTLPGLMTAEWNPVISTQMALILKLSANEGWKVVIQNITVKDDQVYEKIIEQRNFLQAQRLDILWHPQGTHLVVKVTKINSTEYSIFVLGEKSASVHPLQVEKGLSAGRFAWRPSGPHFAVIYEDRNKVGRLGDGAELRIYSIGKSIKPLASYSTSATHLFWAPRGTRVVATNYDKSTLHFYGINDSGVVVQLEKVTAPVTDSAWDPTGRFYATWVSALRTSSDNQFRIFDLNGRELMQKQVRQLSHFSWRPLAAPVLSQAEMKDVQDHLQRYAQRYEEEAADQKNREVAEVRQKAQEKEERYIKRMKEIERYQKEKGFRNIREELIASSCWARLWARRMKNLPDEEARMHEDVVEERIQQRRPLN